MVRNDNLMQLGEFIRKARVKRRLTQDELAEAACICKKHLSGIEKGRSNPSFIVLYQLFSVLQIPLEPLFYPGPKSDRNHEERLLLSYRQCPLADQTLLLNMTEHLATELLKQRSYADSKVTSCTKDVEEEDHHCDRKEAL